MKKENKTLRPKSETLTFGQIIKTQTGISGLDWKVGKVDWTRENENLIDIPISIGLDYIEHK